MWYSDAYRRHLCDMHIDDWDESFLRDFSPREYVDNLKTARINNAMVYLQSHVGLCYFPTKTGVMHRALQGRESLMRDVVELCHENDIRVTGYYSINYNTREHDRHSGWRMVKSDGLSQREAARNMMSARYGLCCPNSREYNEFVFSQIDEMLSYFDIDALFLDMPFWPHTCYCENCRRRWADEYGGEMPVEPAPGTKEYDLLIDAKYRWMGQWCLALTGHIKSVAPDMPVEFNYAAAISDTSENGCGDMVNQASDYVGGDLYGGMREHSFSCKFYRNATRDQPFEYMFSRCKPRLRMHTLTKTPDEMRTSTALTMAHHGATLVIDAIDPTGTMDRRVYQRLGDMFAFQQPYEKWFTGDMAEDIGLYYGVMSRYTSPDRAHNSIQSCVAIANGLIARHIPFGVTGAHHDISRYPILAAPAHSALEENDNARLIDYVENGGTLYISGGSNKALIEELTGGRLTGVTNTACLYIAPVDEKYEALLGGFTRKYPLPFEGNAPIIEGVEPECVIAKLTLPYTSPDEVRFASIHSNPPGEETDIPMIVVKRRGKGTVIWSAATIEGVEMDEYQSIIQRLIMDVRSDMRFSIESDAPADVELTLFRDEKGMCVNAVHLSDASVSPAVPGFTIRVRTDAAPEKVLLLPEEGELPFEYEDGYTSFKARTLNIFDMYRVCLE